MDLQLKDKVALITGGSKGIGLATARVLAAEGCSLGLCARGEEALQRAADELRAAGVAVCAAAADVFCRDDAERFVARCVDELGGIDILINNVGRHEGRTTLADSREEDWLATFEGNVFQVRRMIQLAVPHMRKRGGAIVNVSSISGWHPQLGGNGQYGGSKAALIYLTEIIALELVRDAIRVNCVSPGSIICAGNSWDEYRKANPEVFARYVRDGFPMGRLGSPEEVANVIAFLGSPRANWINGRHIGVDGLEQPVPVETWKRW